MNSRKESQSRWYEANKKIARERAKALGLCVDCEAPAATTHRWINGKRTPCKATLCADCQLKRGEATQRYRENKKGISRTAEQIAQASDYLVLAAR